MFIWLNQIVLHYCGFVVQVLDEQVELHMFVEQIVVRRTVLELLRNVLLELLRIVELQNVLLELLQIVELRNVVEQILELLHLDEQQCIGVHVSEMENKNHIYRRCIGLRVRRKLFNLIDIID